MGEGWLRLIDLEAGSRPTVTEDEEMIDGLPAVVERGVGSGVDRGIFAGRSRKARESEGFEMRFIAYDHEDTQ